MGMKKVINTKELAEMLDISIDKARQLTRAKNFPAIKVGREKKIILSKLDEWLEQNIGNIF
jgi:excisionase family DNA binding protein